MAVACGYDGHCSSPSRSAASCDNAGLIHAMNDTNEQMILSFDSLIRGRAEVSIAFDYSLRPGLEGLYRSQITGTAIAFHPHLFTFCFSICTTAAPPLHYRLSTRHKVAGNVCGAALKGEAGGRGGEEGESAWVRGLLDTV